MHTGQGVRMLWAEYRLPGFDDLDLQVFGLGPPSLILVRHGQSAHAHQC